jgi:vancomycin aglycone glucosyltransferase
MLHIPETFQWALRLSANQLELKARSPPFDVRGGFGPREQAMRVVIAVEGTRGDVYPMLALGSALVAAGHAVRVCGPPDFRADVVERGMDFVPFGIDVRAFMGEVADAVLGGGHRFARAITRFGRLSVASQFAVLPDAMADADRVFGAGTVLGAASAAELHGVPYRYFAYTPALFDSAQHTPAAFPFQFRSPWANRLLWWCAHRMMNAVAGRDVNRHRGNLGLPPVANLIRHVSSPRPILAVDRDLAPLPDDCPYDCVQIRCLHPLEGEPLPEKLAAFLAAGPAPVYLGFGSMPDPRPRETTGRLLDAIAGAGCRALISRGWAGLGDGPLPEGVLAIDPVSHASLFPRVAAVVHHGGAGTTHSAARAGVPQILIPHVLDQFYFARRVVDLGVGPKGLSRKGLRVDELVETLRATLDNEFVAERARDLGARLRELGPTVPDLAALLAKT